ncbi:MAG: PQQ-binding-like beta-propeller repeat protein [Vicinamibacteria bacterium]
MPGIASVLLMAATSAAAAQESTALTAADLAGAWAGTISHAGTTTAFALELEPDAEGKLLLRATLPAMHLARVPFSKAAVEITGNEAKTGPFAFRYDRAAGTLSGTMPASLLPVYEAPFVLRRVDEVAVPPRPEIQAPLAQPAWTFDAGSPLWPGATFADGSVYAGAEDGRLHALDARTGEPRWSFATGGPLRSRATVHAGVVYLQSDDGFVYALGAADGAVRWRTRVAEKPVERLPFDNPKSRYDRYASGVTLSGTRLFLGTNEGKLVALEAATGAKAWEFAAGDAVLAAPAVEAGRVYFGSFDKHVYALEAADGRLVWKRDTRMPVVSTPAVDRGVVVIGSRSYDLLGLDASTGEPRWTRYLWFSWIESSPTLRDGVAYVGSSDAAIVLAVDTQTGRDVWTSDVWGWAWDQPAVTADRVYIGTSGQVGYPVTHRGGALALDRKTGRPAWQFLGPVPPSGAYGFTGSPDVGNGLAFFTALDGKVYAFSQ